MKYVNYAFYVVFAWMLFQRAPAWIEHFKAEGTKLPPLAVPLLDGDTYHSAADRDPRAIVFWATWCGPCTLELKRIQKMIDSGQIPAASVLAISSHEDPNLLRQTATERSYTFPVGLDQDGAIAQLLGITATPTIILKSAEGNIDWLTNGLSPTLEWRLKSKLMRHSG